MTRDAVAATLRELLAESTAVPAAQILDAHDVVRDLGLSSLELVVLGARIEAELGLLLDLDDVPDWSVGSLAEAICARLVARDASG